MKPKVIFKIAFKNLWSHRLRTLLTVTGVVISIAAILFLVSLGYGLEQLVTNQVANFDAFAVIDVPSTNNSNLKLNDQSIEKIIGLGHVSSVASVTNLAGRIKKAGNDSTAETVIISGDSNYWTTAAIRASKGALPASVGEVAVNKSIINLIGADAEQIVGESVNVDLIIPSELRTNPEDGLKVVPNVSLKVSGILDDDTSPIVYVFKDLLIKEDAASFSSLKVKADDNKNIANLREQLQNIGYQTEYIGDTVDQISQVFSLFRLVLVAFGAIALVVASLGTFNTLTISLLERIREVGLFKALGMRNKDVYKLFLSESLIIGIFGGMLGLVIGWGAGKLVNFILSYMAERSNAEAISIFVTPWSLTLAIAVFSVIVAFLTGWYPSKRAVKIDPLDALRFE